MENERNLPHCVQCGREIEKCVEFATDRALPVCDSPKCPNGMDKTVYAQSQVETDVEYVDNLRQKAKEVFLGIRGKKGDGIVDIPLESKKTFVFKGTIKMKVGDNINLDKENKKN